MDFVDSNLILNRMVCKLKEEYAARNFNDNDVDAVKRGSLLPCENSPDRWDDLDERSKRACVQSGMKPVPCGRAYTHGLQRGGKRKTRRANRRTKKVLRKRSRKN